MVRHLLSTGRRRILLLKGFADHYFSREMERGYRDTLTQAGVEIDEDLILDGRFHIESAVDRIRGALDAGLEFDGVMTNDEMAAGVLHTLRHRGLNVPGDIAVAGCDGLNVGPYLCPSLTTVLLDYNELGRMAVERIFDDRRASRPPCRLRMLPRLEVRESTGPGHVASTPTGNKGA